MFWKTTHEKDRHLIFNLKPANDDFTDVDDIFFVTGDDFHGFGISETVHSDGVGVDARDSRRTNFGLKLV